MGKTMFWGKTTKRQKWVTFLTHFTCLGALFFLPEVMMNISSPHHDSIPTGIYVKFVIYIIVFYLNYYIIIDRCLNKKNSIRKIMGYNVLVIISALLILYVTWHLTAAEHPIHIESNHQPFPEALPPHSHGGDASAPPHSQPAPPPHLMTTPGELHHIMQALTSILRDTVILVLAIALSIAIKFSHKWINAERNRQHLLFTQREEELKNLKSQLNPHFLFNTLNTIYALIEISPQKAKHAVHEISHLLRYVLYENASVVTLSKEIKFIETYIDLMRLRIGDKTRIDVHIDDGGCGHLKIAPLLFITIIENVFKHGNTGKSDHEMNINIIANNGVIKCHTSNNFDKENRVETSEGIGITNLRRRLNLIYGEDAKLECRVLDDCYTVDLEINLNNNQ